MKKVMVFEHSVYNKALEKELYYFCLKRQLSLIKYFFPFLFASFFHFINIIPIKKYYEIRWSFLDDVKDLKAKTDSFWQARKKKLAHFPSDGNVVWISVYPDFLLKNFANQYQAELIANKFDVSAKTFMYFEDIYHLYKKTPASAKTQIYDGAHSKFKNEKNAEFIIVYNRKAFVSSKKYWIYRTIDIAYTYFMLIAMGFCLGVVSMYFGAAYYLMPMFRSYFTVDNLPALNIFPVILCLFFLYFVFNRVWVSFLLTSIITMGLTWVNYFKLLFRNDPLYGRDLSLFFESMDMAGKYNVHFDWKSISVIVACVLGTMFALFFVRGRIQSSRLRVTGIAILILVAFFSFKNIYTDRDLYLSRENFKLINRWSDTQVYISKGFVYPFIYSFQYSINKAPQGYDEKIAKERLFSYDYSDIPDEKKVNVISIMLEAYNDFSKFEQIEFNKDVYEYLHQLEAESYSGELVTNIFGGGTVDTERSFLTGYTSLYNFRKKVNSYSRYFGDQGYTVEGSHPCYAWFYNRENVNEYLGFDNYYFFENFYSQLANGQIANDTILLPQIIRLYEANKKSGKPYFSFNVTYQNHGPYPSEETGEVKYVKNDGLTDAEYNILNNYFAGINWTTQELKTFIDYFRKEDEPVVIILFGDHNPWLGDNNSVYNALGINLDLGTDEGFYNYFNTPYVIWGNDKAKEVVGNDFKGEGPSIGPYFLMNEFFGLAGYEGNEFMKLSNDLKKDVEVIHNGRYKESGTLTSKLSSESEGKLNDFLQVQYYWMENFR